MTEVTEKATLQLNDKNYVIEDLKILRCLLSIAHKVIFQYFL